MVVAASRGKRTQSGIRPFDPYRDLRPVIELIAVTFDCKADPAGWATVEELRRVARWGPLLGWFYWPGWNDVSVASGFVWVEEGHVVGNVSLRRALGWGGYMIGNVAVQPAWQRRGIAKRLMEAALEEVSARGGQWVGLEVRADNPVACQLYERLGFREVGKVWHLLRPMDLPWAEALPTHPLLRRGRSSDSAALMGLAHTSVPESQRPLLELRREDYQPGWERTLDCWLDMRHESWWVIEEDGTVCGAVRALHERGRRPDRLEVLVSPDTSGRFEAGLVQRGLVSLRRAPKKMVEAMLPAPTQPLVTALEAAGFQKTYALVQMRLELARRVPVQS